MGHWNGVGATLGAGAGASAGAEAVMGATPFTAFALGAGRGFSQIVHFSLAVPGFFSIHMSHVHCSSPCDAAEAAGAAGAAVGVGAAATCGAGRGFSQIVHFSLAVPGFFNMHMLHSHSSLPCAGAIADTAESELGDGSIKVNVGRVAFFACSLARAVAASSLAEVGIVKVKKGKAGFAIASAVSRAERKTLVGSKVEVDALFGCSFSTTVASSFALSLMEAAG